MKRVWLAVLFVCFSSANASEIYNCGYSKANFSNGKMGPLSLATPSRVELSGKSIKLYRPDGKFLISPALTQDKGVLLMIDDGSKVYASAKDRTNFAVSDKISKTTEQWGNCTLDTEEKNKADLADGMKQVESMTSAQAKKYFLSEKHAFTTNCLVWDDVTMITGESPAMLIAGSVNMGSRPKWDGKEYSFYFNGGSMIARFNPSEKRHKLLIQAGDKFYGCGPSEIDTRY